MLLAHNHGKLTTITTTSLSSVFRNVNYPSLSPAHRHGKSRLSSYVSINDPNLSRSLLRLILTLLNCFQYATVCSMSIRSRLFVFDNKKTFSHRYSSNERRHWHTVCSLDDKHGGNFRYLLSTVKKTEYSLSP